MTYRDITFRQTQEFDDVELRKILHQNEMQSWVQLSFEREPSYFLGDGLMGESYSVIAHKKDESAKIMGMYACSFLPVHINRQSEYIGYLGGLRVCEGYRNRIRYIKNGFDSIKTLIPQKSSLPFWFTSIASENQSAKKLLESGIQGLPSYSPIGDMKTVAISSNQAKRNGLLQALKPEGVNELVEFYNKSIRGYQFSPVLTADWLLSLDGTKGLSLNDFYVLRQNSKLVGCLAIWDQRKYKQTVVKGYRFPLSKVRALYNLYAAISNKTPLPKIGDQLEQTYISFVAFDDEYLHLFVAAFHDALRKVQVKNANLAVVGLSAENPLMMMVEENFHIHAYKSCIETVTWCEQEKSNITSHRVQPEIAIL